MGRKNWGDKVGSALMIGLNILFILAGIGIFVAAIISWGELEDIRKRADLLKDLNLDVIIQVVLFSAVALFVCAIFGFIAAVKKLKKLMVFYILFLFVVLTVQMAMGALMLSMNKDDVYNTYREDSLIGYERRQDFQTHMKCCGWKYATEEFFPERVACIATYPLNTTPCADKVQSLLDDWVYPTGIVLVVLSILSLIALIATLVVIFSQRKKKEDFFENPFSF